MVIRISAAHNIIDGQLVVDSLPSGHMHRATPFKRRILSYPIHEILEVCDVRIVPLIGSDYESGLPWNHTLSMLYVAYGTALSCPSTVWPTWHRRDF